MLKKIIYIFALICSVNMAAQRTSSSPYSYFGIGELSKSQTVEQTSMGGIGIAFSDNYHLNLINPAALAHLRYTTYTAGGAIDGLWIQDGSSSQSSSNIRLSYVNFGIPLGRKAGFIFGLEPNSTVGYSINNSTVDSEGNTSAIDLFYGSGGSSRVHASFGMFIFKGFSLGIDADYVFGENTNTILNQRANTYLATVHKSESVTRGNNVKIGLLYKKEFKNKLYTQLGATFKLENNYRLSSEEYTYSASLNSSQVIIPRDTLYSGTGKGELVNPLKTGVGFAIGKNNFWHAEINYEQQDALSNIGDALGNPNDLNYKFDNSSKLTIGGFYLPKINSISSYWDRIIYRAGVRFENTGLLVDGSGNRTNYTPIKDFGISFGMGLPIGKDISNLNLGIEYGSKGTTNNNLIKENYFNFTLSLSLNDSWFIKRRID